MGEHTSLTDRCVHHYIVNEHAKLCQAICALMTCAVRGMPCILLIGNVCQVKSNVYLYIF